MKEGGRADEREAGGEEEREGMKTEAGRGVKDPPLQRTSLVGRGTSHRLLTHQTKYGSKNTCILHRFSMRS